MEIITFGGLIINDPTPLNIEKQFGIDFGNKDENFPVTFPNINKSSCSCDNCATKVTMDNFKITETVNEIDTCTICNCKQNEYCMECSIIDTDINPKPNKCFVVESLSCDHKFHYCCLSKWLLIKTICPLCAKDWKFIDSVDTKIIIHHDNQIEEFEESDTLISQIGAKFNLDMTKYKLTQNKSYVDEYKNGKYALCTPDAHVGFNAVKIYCKMESRMEQIFIKCSTPIKELREEISRMFNIFKDQVKIIHKDNEITKDYDNLNIFNLDIISESVLIIECTSLNEYIMEIEDNFLILYPNCGTNNTNNNIQTVICGKGSWLPYPFIKNVSMRNLSCLLSSLYILIKKVNMNDETIKFVINKFEKYMILYNIHPIQTQLAKLSLESLLKLTDFTDKYRIILSCTFHELLFKMREESGILEAENVLLNSNILCNLLLSLCQAEKINWKYAIKDVQIEKTFNIYSPLVLTNGIPPLLTLNEQLDIVIFTGKGKDISLPIILYNPLTDNEIDVNASNLGKKVADKGDTIMIDDRIYDEGIMVCIDTSNSMDSCSDFCEDKIAKKNDEDKAKQEYYEILNVKSLLIPENDDIIVLQNAIMWFITHPNFNDWIKKYDVIKNIICFEQNNNLEIAKMMAKYIELFRKLLKEKTVNVNGNNYSHLRNNIIKSNSTVQYKTPPLPEYLCPISQDVMIDPVIAKDGFTYEREQIVEWFKHSSISPLIGKKISHKLLDNKTLKIIINEWKEANIIIDPIENNTIKIKTPDNFGKIICKYDDKATVWNIIYEIYRTTGKTHNEYKLKEFGWKSLTPSDLIKNIKSEIELTLINKTMVTIKLNNGFSQLSETLHIPTYYSIRNVIYAYNKYNYHTCEIWANLCEDGDGVSKGQLLSPSLVPYDWTTKLSIFGDCEQYVKKTHYLSRLNVVKKLFDAFINRSIAYSFNTSIGLMSFSDKSKIECEMTPFYESFRDNMDNLTTKGATALYESLKCAAEKLIMWKEMDLEKRGGAKLRVICLSDGKDTESPNAKYQIETLFLKHNIILDCIVIGSDYENYLGAISKKTGGYMFNPSTIKYAFDIMELETMILSKNRAKMITYNGIINETIIPPIENPNALIKAKSINVDKALGKFGGSVKMLQRELIDIIKNPHPDIDIYINDSDIYFWKVVFKGPDGTPYQNGTWLAYIQFPQTYPYIPPNIRFVTPIKHCNINNYGRVCHSILDRNYTPNIKVSLILQCIYGLLLNPDIVDPLDTNLALLYYEANGLYEAQIMEYVNKYALKSRDIWKKELV